MKTTKISIAHSLSTLLLVTLMAAMMYRVLIYLINVRDWTDMTWYPAGSGLVLLKDMMNYSYYTGLASGVYIALQAALTYKYTKELNRVVRVGIIILLALGSLLWANYSSADEMHGIREATWMPELIQNRK